jgi:acetyl-CoA synthetase
VITTVYDSPVAWVPDASAFGTSPLGKMAARHGIDTFEEVAARSISDPAWFWAAAADDVGLQWMTPYETALDLSDSPAFPHFFKGGRLNWADYTVDRWVRSGRGGAEAVWWEGDDGAVSTLTYLDLKERIDRAAGAFDALGIGEGDVIGMLLPMIPETIVTLLAAAKIGAITAPMFSGFGAKPVAERLADSGAKLVVTCDAFHRRSKPVALKEIADRALEQAPSVRNVLVIGRAEVDVPMTPGRDRRWDEALAAAEPFVEARPMDSEAPCVLLYTSGSTGRPKGCVHTHAGLPFKFAQESRHGMGIDETHRVTWLTDMGWVMGTWLTTAALTNGATAILFEGVPDYPEPDRLWAVAERARATALGIAPTVVRALMAHGAEWADRHPLTDLRVIGSTGEPWNVEPWWWCFRHVAKERVPIINMSGGTECGASILCNSICLPIKPAAFSAPTLGMAADVVDQDGRSVRGEVGELVVRQTWPGMTKSLWDGAERYLDTYWSRFPGLWQQGDFAYVDDDGYWYLLGRSDDTIMLAGKRVGPAEIETVLVGDDDVVEAAAIGVPDAIKGEALVCFVVLRDGPEAVEVATRLTDAVVAAEGKTVRPQAIHAVSALPKTRNGKIMRRIAKAAYLGAEVGDITALENPECLSLFRTLAAGAAS